VVAGSPETTYSAVAMGWVTVAEELWRSYIGRAPSTKVRMVVAPRAPRKVEDEDGEEGSGQGAGLARRDRWQSFGHRRREELHKLDREGGGVAGEGKSSRLAIYRREGVLWIELDAGRSCWTLGEVATSCPQAVSLLKWMSCNMGWIRMTLEESR
jgi:hypothetical protein